MHPRKEVLWDSPAVKMKRDECQKYTNKTNDPFVYSGGMVYFWDSGSPNLSHMHTNYLLNSISLSPSKLLNPLSSPLPPSPPLSCPRLHQVIFTAKYDRVRLTNIKCSLCDICNAGWHMDCLLPPLTTIPHRTWKCPSCTPRHLLPQIVTWQLRLPAPILDFNSY